MWRLRYRTRHRRIWTSTPIRDIFQEIPSLPPFYGYLWTYSVSRTRYSKVDERLGFRLCTLRLFSVFLYISVDVSWHYSTTYSCMVGDYPPSYWHHQAWCKKITSSMNSCLSTLIPTPWRTTSFFLVMMDHGQRTRVLSAFLAPKHDFNIYIHNDLDNHLFERSYRQHTV